MTLYVSSIDIDYYPDVFLAICHPYMMGRLFIKVSRGAVPVVLETEHDELAAIAADLHRFRFIIGDLVEEGAVPVEPCVCILLPAHRIDLVGARPDA